MQKRIEERYRRLSESKLEASLLKIREDVRVCLTCSAEVCSGEESCYLRRKESGDYDKRGGCEGG